MGETIKSADGAESLLQALKTAKAGTTIELAPGGYGDLNISVPHFHPWGSYAGEVTVRSADPGNPAIFNSISLHGVKNLTFDGVVIDYRTPQHLSGDKIHEDPAILVRSGTNITIRNSVLDGDVLDDPSSVMDGLPVARGLTARWSDGIVVENNEFLNWKRGATFSESSNIVVSGNEVHTIRSDGFNFSEVQDVVIEDNYFHDFVTAESVGDHRDMIQFWTAGDEVPSTGIVIRDNVLNSGTGAYTQSIFMRNEMVDSKGAGLEMFYRNIVIENNVIYNAHNHGITVGETDGLTITNNTLLHNPDSDDRGGISRPEIKVASDARNVHIARNIAQDVPEPSDKSVGWKIADNLIVQNVGPEKPNYYGDLFINALTGGGEADLAALQALPGGIVEKGGYGSSLTRFDKTPETLTAIIRPEGDGDDTFSFAGGYSANAKGLVGSGANFTWDMGDGTSRKGIDIEHTYAKPGTYTVTLTVTDANGGKDSALAEAYVPEPVRLDLDVTAKGLVDLSTYAGAGLPSVKVVEDGDRYAARLTDKTGFEIGRHATPIYDLDAFTISLDLKAASGAASAGELFRIPSSMLLTVGENGGFTFKFTNDSGQEFQLNSAPTWALDGDWHTVSLTYDKADGTLVLFLDGVQAGLVAASGSTRPMESWGLDFGASGGKTGFDGLIDDVEFRDEALSASEIAERHGSLDGPVLSPESPIELPEQPKPSPEPEPEPAPGDLSFDLAIVYENGPLIDGDLVDGELLALDDLDDGRVTLIATPSEGVGSVRLHLVGINERVENVAPYVLFGDSDGDLASGTKLGAGDYEMVLTAYSGSNGSGEVLGSDTIFFTVADQPASTPGSEIVHRWNAGSSTVKAVDGGPDWVADAGVVTGSTNVFTPPVAIGARDPSVPGTTPDGIFTQERWGDSASDPMGLEFGGGKLADGLYAVRLYMGNGAPGTSDPGERIFDVTVENQLFLDDLDLSDELGHLVGGMFEWRGTVDDGRIDIDFDHVVQNPLINGVEIIRLDDDLVI